MRPKKYLKSINSHKNSNRKCTVVYYRVSSGQQELEMQKKSFEPFRDLIVNEEICEIEDDGVSAIKLEARQRPGFNKLIQIIEEGKVDKLYVYSRDRLARIYSEYAEFANLLYKFDVKVIFTCGEGYAMFNSQKHVEFSNGANVHNETVNRLKREKDKQLYNPGSKLGFKIVKTNGEKFFYLDEKYSVFLQTLFEEAQAIQSKEEFINLCQKYKKLLGKSIEDIFRYLQDSYYAGYLTKDNTNYKRNTNIEPLLTIEDFKEVLKVISPYIAYFSNQKYQNDVRNFIQPICGRCGKMMKFHSKLLEVNAYYKCKIHKEKIMLTEYNDFLLKTYQNLIINLLNKRVIESNKRRLRKFKSPVKEQLKRLEEEYKYLRRDIFSIKKSNQKNKDRLRKKAEEIYELESLLQRCELSTIRIDKIANQVINSISSQLATIQIDKLMETFNKYYAKEQALLDARHMIKDIIFIENGCFDVHVYQNWAFNGLEEIQLC